MEEQTFPHHGGGAHACRREGTDGSHLPDKLISNRMTAFSGTEEILSAQTALRKAPSLLFLGGPMTNAAKSNLSKYNCLKYWREGVCEWS